MSVLNVDAEITIASIVEAMLPRFSDSKLGLLVPLELNFSDHGYAADGNTLEREELTVRRYIYFLFVRPSNYTQVYFYEPDNNTNIVNNVWKQTSDHDSCWRSDGLRNLAKIYFECNKKFEGRKISGKEMRPCDVHSFHLINQPKYVQLLTHEQVNKNEKFEKSWDYKITLKDINPDELEVIGYVDKDAWQTMQKFFSGMLIKGSEDHQRYMKRKEYSKDIKIETKVEAEYHRMADQEDGKRSI